MQPITNESQEPIELLSSLELKDGLVIHPHAESNKFSTLEDPESGKFFRIGLAERDYLVALLETRDPVAAHKRCNSDLSLQDISINRAEKFCKWLETNRLVETNQSDQVAPRASKNPLMAFFFWKLPLLNPNKILETINQTCGWLFSPLAMFLSLVVFGAGIAAISGRWEEFFASYENLLSSWRWLAILAIWCVLKIVHEIAHGVTCCRYGGEVKEAGIATIMLMPIAYVDVTSSWRFASRWQRLHVTSAGVVVELCIAGLALLIWDNTNSLPLKQVTADIVLMASVTSLLFNLNPLLKFDGYFALADTTGVDNLYGHGQSYARYFGTRYLLGVNVEPPKIPNSSFGWIKVYGCAAAVYRVFTVTGLLAAAAALFHGAGIVIAVAGFSTFVIVPVIKLSREMHRRWSEGNLSLFRLGLRLTCFASIVIGPFWLIPASGSWTSPAIVEFSPPAVLRSQSNGFIEQIHVTDGQLVTTGQAIVTLSNDELHLQLFAMKKELTKTEHEIRAAQWAGESSELADAEKRRFALQEQLRELQDKVDRLVLRAPSNGQVLARNLNFRVGSYVEMGEELGSIGREDSKRLKTSISHTQARSVRQWQDDPVRVVFAGLPSRVNRIARLESRAETVPPDPSLLAINGGSLASRLEGEEQVLCEARFSAYVDLTPEQSLSLRCGQRASVFIDSGQPSLGNYWMKQCFRYLTY